MFFIAVSITLFLTNYCKELSQLNMVPLSGLTRNERILSKYQEWHLKSDEQVQGPDNHRADSELAPRILHYFFGDQL